MGKQHKMGRRSHLAQDAELQQNLPEVIEETGEQEARPTVHARGTNQRSKKEPAIKSSRSGKPHRVM